MSEVVLDRACKSFAGDVVALDDVSLTAHESELLVLVGPSGCGKTTTLRLIAGLDRPSSGSIRIGGREMHGVPPGRRDVAMVFQDAPLYPHMTVRKNLAFPLRAQRQPRAEIERRVDEAARLLGLLDLLERKPGALSGGQRQRVALGRSIVRRPRVWLLDEPLSDLDPGLRAQLRAEIKAMQRTLGITTIYVTHDQEEAMALADRLVVMRNGAVQQVGGPMALYRRPANRFVAGFLGSPGMNFIPGRLQSDGGECVFEHDAGSKLSLRDGLFESAAMGPRQEVVLGVRPEHLRAASAAAPANHALSCRVVQVELLGDRANVHVETSAGARLIWQAACDTGVSWSVGQDCRLAADPAKLHLFEPGEPGRTLRVDSPDS
jgi:multiple sugar transport system ATP-binding protein